MRRVCYLLLGLFIGVKGFIYGVIKQQEIRNVVLSASYLEARAAAAAKRKGEASSAPPVEVNSVPIEKAVESEKPPVAASEPIPSAAIRQVLEVLGSRIARDGRPLKQNELETFLKNLDSIIVSLGGSPKEYSPPPPPTDIAD
uniref:Uncharacterized protein n=1 Tax=Aureoumbra lagunensis TaxID=44058 RepID=A0A7S3JZB4_9STRA|mmetsp:Transcript_8630/g.10531  ORF Transcript_8630/g.10531 Transcript_8630/m.10531 type:complete len:143 (-) Transcript_8630:444-872(-)